MELEGTEMQTDSIRTRYKTQRVDEVTVFYREAGPADAPVILLLHGFATASHMFRYLIALLAKRYRLIAPDLPALVRQRPRHEVSSNTVSTGLPT
jgi:pimeloyl-ACP methyl ester carboxylesterase